MEVAENIRFVSSADNLVVRKMTGLRSEKDYPDGYTCKYISIIARNHAAFTSGLPARLWGQGKCEEQCWRQARSQATVRWFEQSNTIGAEPLNEIKGLRALIVYRVIPAPAQQRPYYPLCCRHDRLIVLFPRRDSRLVIGAIADATCRWDRTSVGSI